MHTQTAYMNRSKVFAPYMVVNPGENWATAAIRHRRETGHRGPIIVAAVNRGSMLAA